MKIADLAGIEKPLNKIVEVFGSGLGTLTKKYFTKKMTDAKVDEIERISKALEKSAVPIQYNNGEIIAKNYKEEDKNLQIITNELNIEERAKSREEHKAARRQDNIENITSEAFLSYINDKNLNENYTDEKPSEDWINRFFDYAEDISSEEMQHLWSKVLEGEIKRPNSYSLKTLEFLKTTSKEDARSFNKIVDLIFVTSNSYIIPRELNKYTNNIQYNDILVNIENNLIMPTENMSFSLNVGPTKQVITFSNKYIISLGNLKKKINIPAYGLTQTGVEIFNLTKNESSIDYIKKIAKLFVSDSEVNIYEVTNLKEMSGETTCIIKEEIKLD